MLINAIQSLIVPQRMVSLVSNHKHRSSTAEKCNFTFVQAKRTHVIYASSHHEQMGREEPTLNKNEKHKALSKKRDPRRRR
jgi:hypothetical protein